MSSVIIAIDGPAASGKSSVARTLARRLRFLYINTGAMYRAVTWLAVKKGIATDDEAAVLGMLDDCGMRFELHGTESAIELPGEDIASHLGDQEVNQDVSNIATMAGVRQRLVARQRAFAGDGSLVMEGRDIGSAVFPETPYKFYIDASQEVRARRREAQGLLDEISKRDRTDSSRKASPLIIAEDAHVIDSSYLTIDGVVGEIIGRLKLRGLPLPPGSVTW